MRVDIGKDKKEKVSEPMRDPVPNRRRVEPLPEPVQPDREPEPVKEPDKVA